MRVLHLTTEFPPVIYGGLGTAVGGLVKASANCGITVGVLLIGSGAEASYDKFVPLQPETLNPVRRRRAAGATVLECSWSSGIAAIVERGAKWRPHIIHLHSFWLWPIAAALRGRIGKPLVYTVHSLDRAEYELGQGPAECLSQWVGQETVIRGADRVIALTLSERELLRQYCPGVEERVRVVGNGIEDSRIRPQPNSRSQAGQTVLFTGRFVERKGIRELIEAIGVVLARAPSIRFILAGGHRGSSRCDIEAWLLPDSLRAYRERIQFTGWLTPNQMAAIYRAADILVVPSWYEPFGMVILEGMLFGLAVAASAVGGPAEILEHDRTGILFPPRSAPALAAAILSLVSDRERCERLAKAGAKEVRENWLWPKIVAKMLSVYSEICPESGCG